MQMPLSVSLAFDTPLKI